MRKIIVFLFSLFLILPAKLHASSNVKINEFLAHPSSGAKEWVELYNPDRSDLSTFWLDDDTDFESDSGSSSKKGLSSLVIDNSTYPFLEFSSFFNNSGDFVVLFSQDGVVLDQYQYPEDPGDGVSVGRFPDGTGSFSVLSSSTKGSQNSSALVLTPTLSNTPTPVPTKVSSSGTSLSSSKSNSKTPTPTKAQVSAVKEGKKEEAFEPTLKDYGKLSEEVFGISSNTPSVSKVKTEKNEAKVLGESNSNLPKILLGIGFIFALCGILSFLILRIREKSNVEQ